MNRIKENFDKIYPWIKVVYGPNETVPHSKTELKLSEDDSPVKQQWLDNLIICYVIDEGSNFSLILNREINDELTLEELNQRATENLARDIEYRFSNTNFGGYGLLAGGDHEAGAICLPEIWEWIGEHLNDNLIVSIPAKDLIMLVPETEEGQIERLKQFNEEVFQSGERLLTKTIFRYDRISKTWSVYKKQT